MKFIKYLPTNQYCVVEKRVNEVVAVEGKFEVYENFLKTYVAPVSEVPAHLLPEIIIEEET